MEPVQAPGRGKILQELARCIYWASGNRTWSALGPPARAESRRLRYRGGAESIPGAGVSVGG